MCLWLCSVVVHNTALNSSDNLPSSEQSSRHKWHLRLFILRRTNARIDWLSEWRWWTSRLLDLVFTTKHNVTVYINRIKTFSLLSSFMLHWILTSGHRRNVCWLFRQRGVRDSSPSAYIAVDATADWQRTEIYRSTHLYQGLAAPWRWLTMTSHDGALR